MIDDVPAGFVRHDRASPVTDPWEPLYARYDDGVVRLGVRLAERHCNSRGFVHGGVIAALADNAMGLSCGATLRQGQPDWSGGLVTVSLSLDYTATALVGAWLEIAPRVIRVGRSLAFADALVTADDAVIARASATFKV